MCGIVGYFSRNGNSNLGLERLDAMRDTMVHRGPDGFGSTLFQAGRVGLAHRRLAIVDLSPSGHEPMPFQDNRYWLTFNGEIYNAAELRETLRAQGCAFRSTCDAEVLLAAYATWGKDCIHRFNGMWAFAIWDETAKTLFCSRDRFGIKPFYYADDGELFVFGSEIRAILASGHLPLRVHAAAMVAYLQNNLVDGLEETFFAGIRRLEPGCCLLVDDTGTQCWRYWDLEIAPFPGKKPTPNTVATFKSAFDAAVSSHMVSDVPLGVSLSGGLDSSAIFATASKLSSTPLHTYSAYYGVPGPFDERRYSDQMIDRYPAQAYQVCPDGNQLLQTLPRIIWHLEEPPLAHGVYPRWRIAELASQHVKVLLVGQGADELLAGYSHYFGHSLADYLSHGYIFQALKEWAWNCHRRGRWVKFDLLRGILKRIAVRMRHSKQRPRTEPVLGPLLRGLAPSLPNARRGDKYESRLNESLYYDTRYAILPTLLRYEDKIDMAFSIEGRVPFLDHRFVEVAGSLGVKARIRDGWSKIILREAMNGVMPADVQWRRDKMGFPTPYQSWLSGPLFKETQSRILDSALASEGYLDRDRMERYLADYRQGTGPDTGAIWKWLCLSIWYDNRANLT